MTMVNVHESTGDLGFYKEVKICFHDTYHRLIIWKYQQHYQVTFYLRSKPVSTAPDKALFFKQKKKMLIFFLFVHETVCYGYSLEAPRWGASNEYPQHMFWWTNKISILFSILYLELCTQHVFEDKWKTIFIRIPSYMSRALSSSRNIHLPLNSNPLPVTVRRRFRMQFVQNNLAVSEESI